MIPFIMLKRFQLAGHRPVILIGGATGTIGDPSGKSEERQLQSLDKVNENARKLSEQMKKLFLKDPEADFRMVNNYDWTKDISLLEFLRTAGKRFNVNT
ncbi:tyrosine--tRNA ligase, partial [Corynebacterium pyruviciproducens]